MPIRIAKIRRPRGSCHDHGLSLELDPQSPQRLIRGFDVLHFERDLAREKRRWIDLGTSPAQRDGDSARIEEREILMSPNQFESEPVAIELDRPIQIRDRENYHGRL